MRKGSLQLSINAIVILIMAIAMLGVGIFFINSVLKGNLTDVTTLSDDVKQQIKETLRSTDEKVFLSGAPDSNVDIKQNGKKNVFVVVNNKLSSDAEFKITITRDTAPDGTPCSGGCTTNFLGLTEFYSQGERLIPVGEVEDFKIDFDASTTRGSVIYMVKVYSVVDSTDTIYATKELHVTVN